MESLQTALLLQGLLTHSSTSTPQVPLTTLHCPLYWLMYAYAHTPSAKPAVHLHVNLFVATEEFVVESWHWAPLRQGLLKHSLTSVPHLVSIG